MSTDEEEDEPRIGLAEAIAELRSELSRARFEGQAKNIRLSVGEIEVELMLEFARTREATGGLRILSVIDASGKAGGSEKNGHKVKLKLEISDPNNPADKHREISGTSPHDYSKQSHN